MSFDDIRNRVAVVGVGHTQYARTLGRHSLDLIAEALQKALEDSGLRKEDIDGICSNAGSIGGPHSTDVDAVAQTLGLEVNWYGQTWTHGRFCASAVQWASFAVQHGLAKYVACVIGSTRSVRRPGGDGAPEEIKETRGSHGETPHHGMASPGSGAALAARRYFHMYGATAEQLAAVPIAFRKHASLNPAAMMQTPLSMQDYLSARYVCEPLRRWDYCLVNEGGACIIVTTAERARDLRRAPVYLAGMQGIRAGRQEFVFSRPGMGVLGQDVFDYRPKPEDLPIFRTSGLRPSDVDAFYTYDAFSFLVWVTLERFAFCGPGEAPAFTQGGRIELGGQLPMNTNGGLLSEAHVSGWNHQIEIVRQLRGECGERQVKGAKVAMWANSYGDALVYANQPVT